MSENAVIVALPREGERVYRVSSEKVPHLTLLFLGEADKIADLQGIIQFTEHAVSVSEHGDFMLDVDHRGTLGEDEADVLFFSKRHGNLKWIEFFRSQLLQNGSIRAAYESTEQYPEWNPHLTLGYPEAPAKNDEKDYPYGIDWVSFDRIAVWTGDFDGPEFRLEWPERYGDMEAVRMSGINEKGQAAVADILGLKSPNQARAEAELPVVDHSGVKGMKWGVRKDDRPKGYETRQVENGGEIKINRRTNMATVSTQSQVAAGVVIGFATPATPALFLNKRFRTEFKAANAHNKGVQQEKKDAKALSKFEKRVKSAEGFQAIHNGAVPQFNREIGKVNAKKEYQVNLYDHPDVKKKYDAEAMKTLQDAYRASANSLMNKKLTHHVDLEFVNDGADFKIHVKEGMGKPMVEHAATEDDADTFLGKPVRTETGHIYSLEFEDFDPQDVKHVAEVGEEFIEHYGVKGMRWGVRKEDGSGDNGGGSEKAVAVVEKTKAAGRSMGRGANTLITAIGDTEFELLDRVVEKTDDGVEITKRDKVEEHIVSEASSAFRRTDLPAIKSKPEYQEAKKLRNRLLHPKDPATKAYRTEVKDTYAKRLEEVANGMENFSGTRQYTIRERGWELPSQGGAIPRHGFWEVSSREIIHGVAKNKVQLISVSLDEDGFISKIEPQGTALAHGYISTVELGEAFLAHYGVKGMKWGVRRDRMQDSRHAKARISEDKRREKRPERDVRVHDSIGPSRRKKATIETQGGEDHRPTDDAIKVAVAKQKLAKSGVHTLSNDELQEVQRRLNLENDVQRLMKGDKTRGQRFVDGLLGRGDKNDRKDFNYQTGNQARGLVTPAIKTGAKVVRRGVGIP